MTKITRCYDECNVCEGRATRSSALLRVTPRSSPDCDILKPMTTAAVETKRRDVARRPGSYEAYLALPDDGRIVEWVDGEIIEFMPASTLHQEIVAMLLGLLREYVRRLQLGRVLASPYEVKLLPGGPSREPDILFIGRDQLPGLSKQRFEGAPKLVIEVVSPGSVVIDRVDKYLEYERAGVGEYWIVDPRPHQQQADFYVRGADGRFVAATVDEDGTFASAVVPGFRLRLAWLWQPEQTDVVRALSEMLVVAPGISEERRALYRQITQLPDGE